MKRIAIILCFLVFLLSCRSDSNKASSKIKSNSPQVSNQNTPPKGEEFINKLDELGYFKLTDENKIQEVKADLLKTLNKYNFFLTKTENESLIYLDNRFHQVDSEELFEIGGLMIYLELVKPSFIKLGLDFDFKNEKSLDDGKHWEHSIEINGREYLAFDSPFSDSDWEIAYVNFINILNQELAFQGSNEKFYAIRSGNDGSIVMLTYQQFILINASYPSDRDNPMDVNEWKHLIQL